jgi:hypothetical protein
MIGNRIYNKNYTIKKGRAILDKFKNQNLFGDLFSQGNYGYDEDRYEKKSFNCIESKKIRYNSCEICKTVNVEPINLNNSTSRRLEVRITLENVCFNKEVSVGVILCDKCGKIIDFKTFTTILRDEYNSGCHNDCFNNCCCRKSCGTLKRKVIFILPKTDICNPLNLTAHVVAKYTSCKESI